MDYNGLAKEFMQDMRSAGEGYRKFLKESFRGESSVLSYIRKKQGEVVPSNISDALGISSARVTAILNSFESKGLITREIDSGDRRRIIIRLTPEGIEYAEEQRRKKTEMIKDILMLLGEHDAKEYVRITGKLVEVLSEFRP